MMITPQALLEIPQLQASFENRETLEKEDRAVLKQLGLKFRGANAYPMFRAYRPAQFPWFVETAEARFLRSALEQVLDVAPRVRENPKLIQPKGKDAYLLRVPRREGDGWTWEDRIVKVPPPVVEPLEVALDPALVRMVSRMTIGTYQLEADVFMMPSPVRDRKERPYFPYLLLLVNSANGMIAGQELMVPKPSLDAMRLQIPNVFLKQLLLQSALPSVIKIADGRLFTLLKPLEKSLNLKLKLTQTLPAIDAATLALMEFDGFFPE
jgi:hypothetical protein